MKKPARNKSLHGNTPDKCPLALLMIDVVNDLNFPEGRQILPAVLKMALRLSTLAREARNAGVPVIYVNDNFGRWQSDFRKFLAHCLKNERSHALVTKLKPKARDYFVLKPKHSGFYSTALTVLLDYLGVRHLILTGIAGNLCVLYTANDAYMRDYRLYIPGDCTVSNTEEENLHALQQMKKSLHADIADSTQLNLIQMLRLAQSET